MVNMDLKELAIMLVDAEEAAKPISEKYKQDFTEKEAYDVQILVRDEKLRRGQRVIGKKIGFTSQAMRKQFNYHSCDYGNIFDKQIFEQGSAIKLDNFLTPRVEGEIAFILKEDLSGPGVTVSDVVRATDGVMACLEFVDTRWDFGIQVLDSIADNAACGGFVLGSKFVRLDNLDLRYIAMFVQKNGVLLSSGAGVEVMGDPLNAVAWLANKLHEHGAKLKAGDIILSGAITGAVEVNKGDVLDVSFSTLGNIQIRFE